MNTSKQRCGMLNKSLANYGLEKHFRFAPAPKGYLPYRLYQNISGYWETTFGGYYKDVREVCARLINTAFYEERIPTCADVYNEQRHYF